MRVFFILAVVLAGCCPVIVAEEYPPLLTARASGFYGTCSWAWMGDALVVTAAHCVLEGEDTRTWIPQEKDGMPLQLLAIDHDRDIALLSPTGPAPWPEGRQALSVANIDPFSIACYVSFRGEPNCGHVLWTTSKSVAFMASTRPIVKGDSGAALLSRSGHLLGVVENADLVVGTFGLAGRPPPEWALD